MEKEYERIKEEITRIIKTSHRTLEDCVVDILSIKGIRIEADDQSLPPIIDERYIGFKKVECVDIAQQDMLTPDKEGRRFVKVIEKK